MWTHALRPSTLTVTVNPLTREKRAMHHATANSFLFMSYTYAKKLNVSSCWVCTHVPTHAHGGVPLVPIPFSLEQTAEWVIFQNGTVSDHSDIPTKVSGFDPTRYAQQWQSAGYQLRNFTGWRQPPYSPDHKPPFFIFKNLLKGSVCLTRRANSFRDHVLGSSQCKYIYNFTTTMLGGTRACIIRHITNRTGSDDWDQMWAPALVSNFKPYNGTYFICGHKAYPWLPTNWSGSCYMGFIVPGITHYTDLAEHLHIRAPRSLVPWEVIATLLWPQFGSIRALQKVMKLRDILEQVANDTAEALTYISEELALDYLLANEGGTCAVVGSECCTYIPDSSENITHLVDHIRDGVKRLCQSSSDDWWGWMWCSSWTTYLFHGFIIFIVICILLCIIATCVKCFCNCLGASVIPQMLLQLPQLDKQDLVGVENVYEDVGPKNDFPEEFLRLSRISP
ncbi:endogenous retrovirus group PABLB member 1 Env polyprotein-like [Scyliorhinus canicula]|uniref:endogenous retrovirus group PABLB member 1 Env polyprotein-like n=1 Tax=Scyliorhinus canicula TaxID=7830 RepID=UPI0018F3F59A|nr:endogenous retrovirus group PABLB member 1 Env polyprotein-like [Scyliorhinus canicula]